MKPAERLAHLRATCNGTQSLTVRAAQGGYVVNATIQYTDMLTGGVQAAIDHEAIASDATAVAQMVHNFLTTGQLQEVPAPLFDAMNVPLDLAPVIRDMSPNQPGVI